MAKFRFPTRDIIAVLKATAGKVYVASERLGCHPDTIYERAKKVKAVADAITFARGRLVDMAEIGLEKGVLNGEAWAICFCLKTVGKDRGYVERQEHDHRGPDGGPVQMEVIETIVRTRQEAATLPPLPEANGVHRPG